MNIDYLRWILAGCGFILVAGIYVRERLRRKRTDHRKRDLRPDSNSTLGAFSLKATADDREAYTDLPSMRNEPFDPLVSGDRATQFESEIEVRDAADQKSSKPNDPFGIVQIKVTRRTGMCFSGTLLIGALRSIGLEYGAMNIFHKRQGGSQSPLFSVVNLVEPGTFPIDDPGHFESPGVAFFLQLAVSNQPQFAFDEMLRAAQILAARIGGEICDAETQLLTIEKAEAIRESLAPVAG
ncbi:MAG: cell division protein ZipA C-terminal FtsZ-binding domain-containing protein [Methylococcaceae bacterium]|nr:cell division protein ZipA C-terminal FtsZ-binding domain-containing protein [Methylococcaceae bacterium]